MQSGFLCSIRFDDYYQSDMVNKNNVFNIKPFIDKSASCFHSAILQAAFTTMVENEAQKNVHELLAKVHQAVFDTHQFGYFRLYDLGDFEYTSDMQLYLDFSKKAMDRTSTVQIALKFARDVILSTTMATGLVFAHDGELAMKITEELCHVGQCSVETKDAARYLTMMVLGLMQNDSIEQVLKIHYVCPSIRKGHESYWDDRPICFSIINAVEKGMKFNVENYNASGHVVNTIATIVHMCTKSKKDSFENVVHEHAELILSTKETAIPAIGGFLVGFIHHDTIQQELGNDMQSYVFLIHRMVSKLDNQVIVLYRKICQYMKNVLKDFHDKLVLLQADLNMKKHQEYDKHALHLSMFEDNVKQFWKNNPMFDGLDPLLNSVQEEQDIDHTQISLVALDSLPNIVSQNESPPKRRESIRKSIQLPSIRRQSSTDSNSPPRKLSSRPSSSTRHRTSTAERSPNKRLPSPNSRKSMLSTSPSVNKLTDLDRNLHSFKSSQQNVLSSSRSKDDLRTKSNENFDNLPTEASGDLLEQLKKLFMTGPLARSRKVFQFYLQKMQTAQSWATIDQKKSNLSTISTTYFNQVYPEHLECLQSLPKTIGFKEKIRIAQSNQNLTDASQLPTLSGQDDKILFSFLYVFSLFSLPF